MNNLVERVGSSAASVSIIVIVPSHLTREMADFSSVYDRLTALGYKTELLFVIDGNNSSAAASILALSKTHPVKLLSLAESFGRSACLREAVKRSSSDLLLLLPPYEQIAVEELPRLLDAAKTADLILAARDRGADSLGNRTRGWAFRKISQISGGAYRDLACEVRVVRPMVFDDVIIQDGHDVFLPILAARAGYEVEEIVVRQAPSDQTARSHKLGNYYDGVLSLLALGFLMKFTYRPFRFFGGVAFSLIFLGLLVGLTLLFERMFLNVALSDRPMLLVAVLLPMLGIQIGAVGLIAEIVIFTRAKSNPGYRIREIIGGGSEETPALVRNGGAS